ncbi:MAG: hypothetical protein RSC58_10570, partial [Ruthenibacterium sp.]
DEMRVEAMARIVFGFVAGVGLTFLFYYFGFVLGRVSLRVNSSFHFRESCCNFSEINKRFYF